MRTMLLIGTALSLSGCTTLLGENIDQVVPFEGGGTRTFTFKKAYPEQKIATSEIIEAVRDSMREASVLTAARRRSTEGGIHYEGVSIGLSEKLETVELLTYQGTGEKFFTVTHSDVFETLKDNRDAKYPFKVTNGDQEYTFTMTCPNEFRDFSNVRGGMLHKPFFTEEEVINNFNEICVNTKEPTLKTYQTIKGEHNSKYLPIDIKANLERLLRKEKTKNTYSLTISNVKYHILAETVPYRGGSKTIYEFKYPYKLNSSMNSYSSKEIELVQNKIKSIIND